MPTAHWCDTVADLAYGLIFLVSPLILAASSNVGITAGLVFAGLVSVVAIGIRRGFPTVLLALVVAWCSPKNVT